MAVQGASWDRGRGWQTEEGCVIEDFPSQACLIMVGLEETSMKWVVGRAGKNWWAGLAGRAPRSTVRGLGALDCKWVVGSCHSQLLVAAASQLDAVMDL